MTKTLMIFGMLGWDAYEGETELAARTFVGKWSAHR
jgi:hypothetical protein